MKVNVENENVEGTLKQDCLSVYHSSRADFLVDIFFRKKIKLR